MRKAIIGGSIIGIVIGLLSVPLTAWLTEDARWYQGTAVVIFGLVCFYSGRIVEGLHLLRTDIKS